MVAYSADYDASIVLRWAHGIGDGTIEADDGVFDGTIEMRVHDRDDVKLIMDNLKKIEGVQNVNQIL